MSPDHSTAFCVADWLVRPQLNRIERGGQVRKLEPKVMEVLCFLAQHRGSVATRQAIFENVWSDTVVTDDVLTRCISELRKAFGDSPRAQSIIETIPKTGYRIVAEITPAYDAAANAQPSVAAPNAKPANTRSDILKWIVFVVLVCGFSFIMWLSMQPPPKPFAVAARPLTAAAGSEVDPDISSNGRSIAYAWAGEDGNNWDIYVRDFDHADHVRLTDDPAREGSPAFSSDGADVAFIRYTSAGCEVAQVGVVSRTVTRVGSCSGNVYPDVTWSPDGRVLAHSGRESSDQPFAITFLSAEDGSSRRVTNPPASVWGDHDPSFSPKGRTLAFTRSASEGIQDLYLLDIRSGVEKRLTADARNILGHDWLPGGDDLLVATNRGGGYALWKFPVDGSAPTPVFSSGWTVAKPTISENGRVVVEQSQSDVNIWTIANPAASTLGNPGGTLDTAAAPARLEASTRWDMHPALSPDGSRVAYTSNRTGSYEVWIGSRTGGAATQRTNFDGPFTGTPRWSPDGRHVAFDARPDGTADIFVLDADGGAPRRLTEHPANDLAPSWSLDGKWIYFASTRSGAWNVWRASAEAGESAGGDSLTTQVTVNGGFSAFEAADGSGIYFTRSGVPGLWFHDFSDGSESHLSVELTAEDWASWGVAPDGVYYLRRRSQTEIVRFDPARESKQVVFTIAQPVPHSDTAFSVSADGAWLAWGQIDRQEVDLLSVGAN